MDVSTTLYKGWMVGISALQMLIINAGGLQEC